MFPLSLETSILLLLAAKGALTAPQDYQHVLMFSVDGLHSSDIAKYNAVRPKSTIASLLKTGYEYTNAYTSAVGLVKTHLIQEAAKEIAALGFLSRHNAAIHRRQPAHDGRLVRRYMGSLVLRPKQQLHRASRS